MPSSQVGQGGSVRSITRKGFGKRPNNFSRPEVVRPNPRVHVAAGAAVREFGGARRFCSAWTRQQPPLPPEQAAHDRCQWQRTASRHRAASAVQESNPNGCPCVARQHNYMEDAMNTRPDETSIRQNSRGRDSQPRPP